MGRCALPSRGHPISTWSGMPYHHGDTWHPHGQVCPTIYTRSLRWLFPSLAVTAMISTTLPWGKKVLHGLSHIVHVHTLCHWPISGFQIIYHPSNIPMPQSKFLTPLISIVQSRIQVGKCHHCVFPFPTNHASGPFTLHTNDPSNCFPSYQVLSVIHIHLSHICSKNFWSSVLDAAYALKASGNVTLPLLSAYWGFYCVHRVSQISVTPSHIHSAQRRTLRAFFLIRARETKSDAFLIS